MKQMIFICYSRNDTGGYAKLLYDRLVKSYGEDAVFRDIDAIRGSDDWQKKILAAIQSSGIVLAIIGDDWRTERDAATGETDWVKWELKEANNADRKIVPILVGSVTENSYHNVEGLPFLSNKVQGHALDDKQRGRLETDYRELCNIIEHECPSLHSSWWRKHRLAMAAFFVLAIAASGVATLAYSASQYHTSGLFDWSHLSHFLRKGKTPSASLISPDSAPPMLPGQANGVGFVDYHYNPAIQSVSTTDGDSAITAIGESATQQTDTVYILTHGIYRDHNRAWFDAGVSDAAPRWNLSLPSLLARAKNFGNQLVYLAPSYIPSLSKTYSLDDAAKDLLLHLNSVTTPDGQRLLDAPNIVFIAQGLSGLVARVLLSSADLGLRQNQVVAALFIGSPCDAFTSDTSLHQIQQLIKRETGEKITLDIDEIRDAHRGFRAIYAENRFPHFLSLTFDEEFFAKQYVPHILKPVNIGNRLDDSCTTHPGQLVAGATHTDTTTQVDSVGRLFAHLTNFNSTPLLEAKAKRFNTSRNTILADIAQLARNWDTQKYNDGAKGKHWESANEILQAIETIQIDYKYQAVIVDYLRSHLLKVKSDFYEHEKMFSSSIEMAQEIVGFSSRIIESIQLAESGLNGESNSSNIEMLKNLKINYDLPAASYYHIAWSFAHILNHGCKVSETIQPKNVSPTDIGELLKLVERDNPAYYNRNSAATNPQICTALSGHANETYRCAESTKKLEKSCMLLN